MTILGTDVQDDEYDVVICGAGIAGQTLARQLKLNFSDISVLMLEKAKVPLPWSRQQKASFSDLTA